MKQQQQQKKKRCINIHIPGNIYVEAQDFLIKVTLSRVLHVRSVGCSSSNAGRSKRQRSPRFRGSWATVTRWSHCISGYSLPGCVAHLSLLCPLGALFRMSLIEIPKHFKDADAAFFFFHLGLACGPRTSVPVCWVCPLYITRRKDLQNCALQMAPPGPIPGQCFVTAFSPSWEPVHGKEKN